MKVYRSRLPENDIGIANVLNDLAQVERENRDFTSAKRDLDESLCIVKLINSENGIASISGRLADLALDREQWAEAESLAREALKLDEKIGAQNGVANNCDRLAKALLKQNRATDEALAFSRRAVEIYTRLKSPDLQWAQETLEEIEKAMSGK